MKIAFRTISDFFNDNRIRGVNLDREMLWTHHFTDSSKRSLAHLIPVLLQRGYYDVDIVESESGYILQAVKPQTHSVRSLYAECRELHEIAEKYKVEDYDGFDVGNVDGSLLLEE